VQHEQLEQGHDRVHKEQVEERRPYRCKQATVTTISLGTKNARGTKELHCTFADEVDGERVSPADKVHEDHVAVRDAQEVCRRLTLLRVAHRSGQPHLHK
jgi:hypothetical protein